MLCGIYCAARLIARYTVADRANAKTQRATYENAAQNAFNNLIQSAEDLKLLKAKKIAHKYGGYYDYEIERIFNNLTPRKRRNLNALAFSGTIFKHLLDSQRRDLIINLGCNAIVEQHGRKHWITVEGNHPDGGYECFDPQLTDNISRRKRLTWDRGVLISRKPLHEMISA